MSKLLFRFREVHLYATSSSSWQMQQIGRSFKERQVSSLFDFFDLSKNTAFNDK